MKGKSVSLQGDGWKGKGGWSDMAFSFFGHSCVVGEATGNKKVSNMTDGRWMFETWKRMVHVADEPSLDAACANGDANSIVQAVIGHVASANVPIACRIQGRPDTRGVQLHRRSPCHIRFFQPGYACCSLRYNPGLSPNISTRKSS